jgi:hypothetical protein
LFWGRGRNSMAVFCTSVLGHKFGFRRLTGAW